ncbi:MAG: hypothetical protein VX908_00045 [Planctomycetota bacterium]|nr:hypothetical protein [Planctomycetota bacterium]
MDIHEHEGAENTPFTIPHLDGGDAFNDEGSELDRLHASARTHQAWLLAVVVAVGIGSIWSMRFLGVGPQAAEASTADEVVETYLESQGKLMMMGMSESILDVLQQSYVNEQVPLSDLPVNPFLLSNNGGDGENVQSAEARARSKLESFIETLTVQSTMTGGTRLASIDGQVLRIGERLEGVPENTDIMLIDVQRHSIELQATDTVTGTTGSWTLQVGR